MELKVFAFHTAVHYREAYGIFASNGILFNHESPEEDQHSLLKIKGLVELKGVTKKLVLGIYMLLEIGVMLKIMLFLCGKYFNTKNQMTG